jgi:hypothetical protein
LIIVFDSKVETDFVLDADSSFTVELVFFLSSLLQHSHVKIIAKEKREMSVLFAGCSDGSV